MIVDELKTAKCIKKAAVVGEFNTRSCVESVINAVIFEFMSYAQKASKMWYIVSFTYLIITVAFNALSGVRFEGHFGLFSALIPGVLSGLHAGILSGLFLMGIYIWWTFVKRLLNCELVIYFGSFG